MNNKKWRDYRSDTATSLITILKWLNRYVFSFVIDIFMKIIQSTFPAKTAGIRSHRPTSLAALSRLYGCTTLTAWSFSARRECSLSCQCNPYRILQQSLRLLRIRINDIAKTIRLYSVPFFVPTDCLRDFFLSSTLLRRDILLFSSFSGGYFWSANFNLIWEATQTLMESMSDLNELFSSFRKRAPLLGYRFARFIWRKTIFDML